jgi:hypothetical protein
MSLGHALRQRSVSRSLPFPHWEIERPLTADARQEVIAAFAPPPTWSDSGQLLDGEFTGVPACCNIIRDNVSLFPALGAVIDELLSRPTIERIETMLSQSMDGGFLKLDLMRDRQTLVHELAATPSGLMSLLISVDPQDRRPKVSKSTNTDVGWMGASAQSLAERSPSSHAADYRWLHLAYVREETDWKLPPRRRAKTA